MSTTDNRFPQTVAKTTTTAQTAAQIAVTKKKVVQGKAKPVLIRPQASRGPRYGLIVEFSSDGGQSYGPDLKALPSTVYRVKMEFTQHQAEPLLQGADFDWILPAGWSFADGHGRLEHEVCISNPVQIMRLVRSAGTVSESFVKVLCTKVYR